MIQDHTIYGHGMYDNEIKKIDWKLPEVLELDNRTIEDLLNNPS